MGRLKGKEPLGATPLDDISGLRPNHITTTKELYEVEFANISSTTMNLFSRNISIDKLFSYTFLLNIHKQMLKDVWTWAGSLRRSNKTVGVDWHQIPDELAKAIRDILYQDEEIDSIEVSARIHHRLVFVHPFENGNGRWARMIANLYLKNKFNKIVKWPDDELYIASDFRKEYISGLKEADRGHLEKLTSIHKELLKQL